MMHTPNQSFYSKLISFSSPAILLESQSSSISVDTPPNSHVVLVNSRVPDTKSHSKTRRDKYAILPTITTPLNRLEFEMLHRFPLKSTFAGTSLTARTTNIFAMEKRVQMTQIETGVKGVSPLTRLQTISIPESSPFDVMHLVFLGFVRDLCALLNGTFFKAGHLNNHPGRMSEKYWVQLGVDMAKIGAPASWGRYPRNIQKYIKGFKAEELSSFLIHYLLPLSFKRVNASTYRALQRLVLSVSLSTSFQLTNDEIEEIELHLKLFMQWFYDTFYQQKYERLPACKYTMHALLHLIRDIQNWGPASYFWQFSQAPRFLKTLIQGTTVWYSRQRCQKPRSWLCQSLSFNAPTSTSHVCHKIEHNTS